MIDIHSHLLPGVDDGSRTVEQSMRVLVRMREAGVSNVCLTPHLSVSDLVPARLGPRLQALDEAYESLLAAKPQPPRLHRGVELMLNEPLTDRMEIDERIALNGSTYVLVEFPVMLSPNAMRGLLGQLAERGYGMVVAHPERYAQATLDEVAAWREAGAAIQVDATTVVNSNSARGTRARSILEAGLADVLGADNHGDDRMLGSARQLLFDSGAEYQAKLLLRSNPAAIIRGEPVHAVPPVSLKRGWKFRATAMLGWRDAWA